MRAAEFNRGFRNALTTQDKDKICELVCSVVSGLPIWPTGGQQAADRRQDTIFRLLKVVRKQSIAKLKGIRSPYNYWRNAAIRELAKTPKHPLGDVRNPLDPAQDGGVVDHQNRHDLVRFKNGKEKTFFHDPEWARRKDIVEMALSYFQELPISTQPILVSLLEIAQLDAKLSKREIDLRLAFEFNISPATAKSLRLKSQKQMEQLLGFKSKNNQDDEVNK